MKIAVMKETHPGERRIPLIPVTAEKLVKLGAELVIEAGLGQSCRFEDADYEKAGATVSASRREMLQSADMVLRLRKPPADEIELMQHGCIHVSYLDPFNEAELVELLRRAKISAVSLEMIPRSTLAQKMDVLSSQASLAGYT
ncbi:NAD(P)(+) transhydrogenase (Re/Si-specific) subunit alpha, partial [Desulfobulbus sp. F3]|nr:NAD(P)(+) transhydrogenase (Re/Si-specific) subunit alpha [Desulfobulbus sp. F3]